MEAAIDTKALLSVIAKCQFLSQSKLHEAQQMGHLPVKQLAKSLIERGWLNLWQVQQLLAGHTSLQLGDYQLLVKIGEGGMGAVYKARHSKTRRLVAVKLVSEKVVKHPGALPRFQREIRAAAALNHPNIVAAFDASQVGDLHFLVMEYVEGRDLKTWVNEFGRLPIDWSCECISQAAEGLEHAHQQGFVHRDIKPGNLIVVATDTSTRPVVKILDLGLARIVAEEEDSDRITKSGHVLGTIDYISPEQIADTRSVDIRGDIFSLGCTLFKALTGQIPFEGRTLPEKVMSRMRSDPPRASRLRPDVPPELDAVLGKMMARDLDNRFQRPSEVVQALAPFCMQRGEQQPLMPPRRNSSHDSHSDLQSRHGHSASTAMSSAPTISNLDDRTRIKVLEEIVAVLTHRVAELEELVKRELGSRLPS